MASIGTLSGTLPWGLKSLKVKRQAFPHNGSTGLKQPAPASHPVTDYQHGAGAKGATGCSRLVREFLGWHRGYLLCPDLLLQSLLLLNLYHFGCYKKNNYKNIHPRTSCWDGQIFSHQFLVVPECPTPLLGRDPSLPSKSCSYCSPDRRRSKNSLLGAN